QLFRWTDHRREAQSDLDLRRVLTELVDISDILVPCRKDLARNSIAYLEHSVEASGDSEPQYNVTRTKAWPLQRWLASHGERSKDSARHCHTMPESIAGASEGDRESRIGDQESELRGFQRTVAAKTRPRTNSRPNAACSCAVSRSIIAMARC